jgi:hypothetical protein
MGESYAMKEVAAIKEVLVVADHQFGMLQLERRGKTTRLLGIALGAGIDAALAAMRNAGAAVTLAVPEPLPQEATMLLKRLLPAVRAVIADPKADVTSSGAEQAQRLVVAADRVLRGRATKAGHLASPHLAIAALGLSGGAPGGSCALCLLAPVGGRRAGPASEYAGDYVALTGPTDEATAAGGW